MLVILPFEQEFYKKYGVEAEFVGHPLLDAINPTPDPSPNGRGVPPTERSTPPLPSGSGSGSGVGLIALLPGSRRQEVQRILPEMLAVTADFPEYEFVVAGSTALPEDFYKPFLEKCPNVTLVRGQTYDLLRQAKAALVKSGTSTLETALFGVPEVVCYAGNPISFFIAKRLVDVKYISLVNLIMDKPLVHELIQGDLNRKNLKAALADILTPEIATQIQAGYAELRQKLGSGGASARAARAILGLKV
jgi:lipid-A-disaccharide synthase